MISYDEFSLSSLSEETDNHHPKQWSSALGKHLGESDESSKLSAQNDVNLHRHKILLGLEPWLNS